MTMLARASTFPQASLLQTFVLERIVQLESVRAFLEHRFDTLALQMGMGEGHAGSLSAVMGDLQAVLERLEALRDLKAEADRRPPSTPTAFE